MSKPRRLWPIVAAALIGAPALYLAGFGPAIGIAQRTHSFDPVGQAIYWPLGRMATDPGDSPVKVLLVAYARMFGKNPFFVDVYVPVDYGVGWFPVGDGDSSLDPVNIPDERQDAASDSN